MAMSTTMIAITTSYSISVNARLLAMFLLLCVEHCCITTCDGGTINPSYDIRPQMPLEIKHIWLSLGLKSVPSFLLKHPRLESYQCRRTDGSGGKIVVYDSVFSVG